MQRFSSRANGADVPPSTSGVPTRHASRWPVRVGMAALAGLAIAAPVMAAEPAAAPRPSASAVEVEQAAPARPVKAEPGDAFHTVGLTALLATATSSGTGVNLPVIPPPPPPAPKPAPKPAPAPAPAPRPEPAPAPAPSSGGSNWDRLAQCESGGNWAINTGNGYYGGLQFSASSWRAVGGTGLPHQASRETQIAMGERLKASGGWGNWPSCARKLGLY